MDRRLSANGGMKHMALRDEGQAAAGNAELAVHVRDGTYVVVPAYNEAACLAEVLRELVRAYPNVVVVDDGSDDETCAIAKRAAPYVIRHLINRGQGAALQTGIEFALRRGAQYVVTFDADGQHRAEDIAGLLRPISRGECEIALGSRFLGETSRMPASRRVMLWLAVLFTRLVNRLPVTDAHNGLRAFSRRAAEQVDISMDRMAHASEIVDIIRKFRLPFREVPVRIRYTEHSLAKRRSLRDALRIVFHYFVGRVAR
jgi:glycosyltransferase involved in cell wall biosynthesis